MRRTLVWTLVARHASLPVRPLVRGVVVLLSEALSTFIRTNVSTVWALELLLLLYREAGRSWTVEELNRELRGSVALVRTLLAKFAAARLVQHEADDRYRWSPSTEYLAQRSEELVAAYRDFPFSVIKAITEAQVDRIQTLADAFKIKKD